jgi:hypothetical protein
LEKAWNDPQDVVKGVKPILFQPQRIWWP